MKAWMVREICKSIKDCRDCPLMAKCVEDDRCIPFWNKYGCYPASIKVDRLLEMFEDEEEY